MRVISVISVTAALAWAALAAPLPENPDSAPASRIRIREVHSAQVARDQFVELDLQDAADTADTADTDTTVLTARDHPDGGNGYYCVIA
ncbi:hypothetical protein DFH09DRAFT_629739 [Mycena vulgaris]|nr:hypothetical protein DFH09DRAFT_629739 [Mycena vulgaris]